MHIFWYILVKIKFGYVTFKHFLNMTVFDDELQVNKILYVHYRCQG